MRILTFVILLFPVMLHAQVLQKAKALYETGKPGEAEKLLSQLENDSKDYAEAQFYLGRITFDKKEYDDASEYFEEATETNDKNAVYFEWLGNAYGMIAKDANVVRQGFLAPKMKAAWEKAVELDPKNIGARLSLIEYYMQAPGFMGGSVDQAIETSRQIVKLDPALGHMSLGNIYAREQKIAEAEKEFLEMIRADDKRTPVLTNFYITHKQYDKAFAILEAQIKSNPRDILTTYQYGKLSAISGKNLDPGEEYLRKYFLYTPQKNEPSHAGAYMRLGMIYEKRGNKAEAKKNFQKALQLDKTMKEAAEGLARVSK